MKNISRLVPCNILVTLFILLVLSCKKMDFHRVESKYVGTKAMALPEWAVEELDKIMSVNSKSINIILPSGKLLREYRSEPSSNISNSIQSREITSILGFNTPATIVKDFVVSKMLERALYLVDREKHSYHADALNGRKQEGLAYVWGSKDIEFPSSSWGNAVNEGEVGITKYCTERLYGLDCSGLVFQLAKNAGLTELHSGTVDQTKAEIWNNAIEKNIYYKDKLKAYHFTSSELPINELISGDYVYWKSPDKIDPKTKTVIPGVVVHSGIVLKHGDSLSIFQSNGSWNYVCPWNWDPDRRGPRIISISQINDAFKNTREPEKGITYAGAIRLVPILQSHIYGLYSILADPNRFIYEVYFAKYDVATENIETISWMPSIESWYLGSSTLDPKRLKYICHTNLGITIIDMLSGNIDKEISTDVATLEIKYSSKNSKLFGVYWDGTKEIFTSYDLTTGERKDLATLPGVKYIIPNTSSLEEMDNYYIINTDQGVLIIDCVTGNIVKKYTTTIPYLSPIHYSSKDQKLYGLYWNGNSEILASLNISDGILTPVGVIQNFIYFYSGSSVLDDEESRLIIRTNLGLTYINLRTASISKVVTSLSYITESQMVYY